MEAVMKETETICCPKFDPEPWDGKVFQWQNNRFIRDHVFTLFYIPMNFAKVMKRLDEKVKLAGAEIPGFVCLSDHTSQWNMDLYLAVDREIPNAENVSLSGKYFVKVYEGSYKYAGRWCKEFEDEVKARGMNVLRCFIWYTTCPKCAKKYGKSYVAIVGEVE